MLSRIFRRKKEEKEQESDASINDWEYPKRISDLAEALEISEWTVRNFLKKKGLCRKLESDARGIKLPKEIVDRILGEKSEPPEQIDDLEYSYPPSWLAKRMGICSRTVRRWIRKKGIESSCKYDGRGLRVPRSVCVLIWPEIGQEGRKKE